MCNMIKELTKGNIEFLSTYLSYPGNKNNLLQFIRNQPDKVSFIKIFLEQIMDLYPSLCFEMIYDIDEFHLEINYLLEKYSELYSLIDQSKLFAILSHTKYGTDFVLRHPEILDENKLKVVFFYIITNKENLRLTEYFKNHQDLHIRYLFMNYLVENDYPFFKEIYPNILDYLTDIPQSYEQISMFKEKEIPKYMDVSDVSLLAAHIKKYHEIDYIKIRSFILKNYEKNKLAEFLYYNDKKELESNINLYYQTTNSFYLTLFKKYEEKINQELTFRLRYLMKLMEQTHCEKVLDSELLPVLYEWTTKYLDLSKSKECKFIGGGSTANCYKIGDYVFKLVNFKWSYEDVICPNLYLILKNEEEQYIRNKEGIVTLGLEVQKYLSRSASFIPPEIFEKWNQSLKDLGYILNDTLVNGECGTNAFLLDSYLEADTTDVDSLPEWFKQNPLVLVDRDRVYKKDIKPYKQLNRRY